MDFSFRPLVRQDFPQLVTWLAKPHVSKWWKEPAANLGAVEKEFGPSIDGSDPTSIYVALIEHTPIGIIQSYMVDAYPEHAASVQLDNAVGIDLFIGEEDFIGKGYGTAMLLQFIQNIVPEHYTTVKWVVADPEVTNIASIRAFEKAGFEKGNIVPGEYGPEQLMIKQL